MTAFAISPRDVAEAAALGAGVLVRTPLLEFEPLNDLAGRRCLVKFEGAQHTGSFKARGAYNRLCRLSADERRAGVVAWSSGNHAQGVAFAARRLGMAATIVMPRDAPVTKLANTRALGAEIVLYDRQAEAREEIAGALATARGAVLVPSCDDPFVIAGQGVVGLEVLEQAEAMGASVGQVLVCCGGGALVAGMAVAMKDRHAAVDLFSVEPAAFDDVARSLASGGREVVAAGARSICDSLLAPAPGTLTLPIMRELVAGGLSVSDEQVRDAMRFAFSTLKLVIEPGGAVALAAALNGLVPPRDGAVVVVVTGSNVDAPLFADILTAATD